jgi:hypothetical protein
VALDFQLIREIGVDTWRGSFGWDDYEPSRGRYDLAWLHRFADVAARYGMKLRPYIGYTPQWAARGGSDDQAWNDPPANLDDWYNFVYALVAALRRHSNVVSYEIYNEENVKLWWDGTVAQYNAVLDRGAAAVHAANPRAQVLLGGMVYPDVPWIEATCTGDGSGAGVQIVPFHAYPETWTPDSVVVENYLGSFYREHFVPTAKDRCRGDPIWINEAGYATTPGRSERAQANWWVRAIATFLADPHIEHIGIYEIKDLRKDSPVIGDAPNYHLGITKVDRIKKLAFHTLKRLVHLLNVGTITVADADATVTVTSGRAGQLYRHLFVRPDGRRVLFVWDRSGGPTLSVRLAKRGASATEYALDGAATAYTSFDGETLTGVRLTPGEARVFEISP